MVHIPQPWAHGLDKDGLLGLINMSHFGWMIEANSCVKQLLACFHGGTLWLDTPLTIIVDLISDITRLPKDGPHPSKYFKGMDNDKWFAAWLKMKYDLQRDGRVYRTNNINDRVVRISARILVSKIVRKNGPI